MRENWRIKDIRGRRFGGLVVLKDSGERAHKFVKWLCLCDCGNKLSVLSQHLISGHTKSCGCLKREISSKKISGENHPNWKGGKRISKNRVYIKKPNHPNAIKQGYVLESRLVAEKALGRYLKPQEAVHHIDGNPQNNKNNNLLVCTRSYHSWLHHKHGIINVK